MLAASNASKIREHQRTEKSFQVVGTNVPLSEAGSILRLLHDPRVKDRGETPLVTALSVAPGDGLQTVDFTIEYLLDRRFGSGLVELDREWLEQFRSTCGLSEE